MGKLSKGGFVLGALGVGYVALKRVLNPPPRYAASAKPRYTDFDNRVLVVGGGFGGYTAAKKVCDLVKNREDIGILMVSRENFFTFWPMVAGIVASEMDTRNVAQPLRRSLTQAGAAFRRAEITKVDPEKKVVVSGEGIEFPYDQLILSVGAQPNYFGIPGVEEHAFASPAREGGGKVRAHEGRACPAARSLHRDHQGTLRPHPGPSSACRGRAGELLALGRPDEVTASPCADRAAESVHRFPRVDGDELTPVQRRGEDQ